MSENTNAVTPSKGKKTTLTLQIIVIALAYFITGKPGTSLAIPPGYATAVWPPSGIALAAVLLYGYRVWPGIMIGSLMVNLPTSLSGGLPSEQLLSFTITFIISLGAALQAVVGGYLLKRFSGFPNALIREKEIFSLLLLGGIVSTLVNSTLAVSVLVAADRVPLANALANWGTWWLGDIIGVLIFTPLVLVWLSRPVKLWHDRRAVITSSILLTFVLAAALADYANQQEVDNLKFEFTKDATALSVALEKQVTSYMTVLHSIASFYSASNSVEEDEFKTFTQNALNRLSGLQALSWNPYVTASNRAAFEQFMQQATNGHFQITERNADGQLIAAAERDGYVPIQFIEPLKGNESALGFDVFSNAIRQDAIIRARDSGEIATTARITLVQEQGNQFGVLAFIPIYENGMPTTTIAERRQHIKGYGVAVFRGGDIVSSALANTDRQGLTYQLVDISAPKDKQLLYSNENQNQPVTVIKELFNRQLVLHNLASLNVGGREWQFEVVPTQEYIASHRSQTTWYILLAALLLSSVIGMMALLLSGRNHLLRNLVKDRTNELEESYGHLAKLAKQVPGMLYQYRSYPDGSTSFPYVSEGINEIYDVTPEQLREDTNHFFSVLDPDDYNEFAESFQKSAETLTPWRLEYRVNLPEQKLQWLYVQAQPEKLEDGSILWHGFITNITKRKAMEAYIREMAFYDSLTKLANRRLLMDRLSTAQATSERTEKYAAILFLDLDNFKPLNDTYGHDTGDLFLIEVATRINNCTRKMDTVSRFGGDEFVVMITELGGDQQIAKSQTKIIAEKIRNTLATPYQLSVVIDDTMQLIEHLSSVSIGCALFIGHEQSEDEILKQADNAMYEAKSAGKNQVSFYQNGA